MLAYTLLNGITVLYCSPDAVRKCGALSVQSVKYSYKVNTTTSSLSGKKKKGAIKIMRGDVLCQLHMSDGSKMDLRSPIAGEIIEINPILIDHVDLLQSENGDGYVLVMLRNKLMELMGSTKPTKNNQCFSFLKGTCTFGDACRFKHIPLPVHALPPPTMTSATMTTTTTTTAAMNDSNDVVESQLEMKTDAKIVSEVSAAAGTSSGSVIGDLQGSVETSTADSSAIINTDANTLHQTKRARTESI